MALFPSAPKAFEALLYRCVMMGYSQHVISISGDNFIFICPHTSFEHVQNVVRMRKTIDLCIQTIQDAVTISQDKMNIPCVIKFQETIDQGSWH